MPLACGTDQQLRARPNALGRVAFFIGALAAMVILAGCATTRDTGEASAILAEGGLIESRSNYQIAKQSVPRDRPGESGMVSKPELCDNPEPDMLEALRRDFGRTLSACDAKLHAFEKRAEKARRTAAWIAILGAVAGSVVVPTLAASASAAKSTIAAWGAVAGLANFAQNSLDDNGLNAATALATREALRADILPHIRAYTSADSNYCDRVLAVSAIAAGCITYSVLNPQAGPDESLLPTNDPSPDDVEEPGEPPAEPAAEATPAEPPSND